VRIVTDNFFSGKIFESTSALIYGAISIISREAFSKKFFISANGSLSDDVIK
jgi:hypothetical protein